MQLQQGCDWVPRLGETVAYALREAMTSILKPDAQGSGGEWRQISRSVVEAGNRYEEIRRLPGGGEEQALNELLSKIDGLANFHSQGDSVYQARLIATVLYRTGHQFASQDDLVERYQGLLNRLNQGLHNGTPLCEASQLHSECVSLLRALFLPPSIRNSELECLARIEFPSSEDVDTLKSIIATPVHMKQFLDRIENPKWFDFLTEWPAIAPRNNYWPASSAVQRLMPQYPEEVM